MGVAWLAAAFMAAEPQAAVEPAPLVCEIARATDRAQMKQRAADIFARADEAAIDNLINCLGDPDPEIRDAAALTIWTDGLRGNHAAPPLMRHALQQLSGLLARSGDAAGFHKPFAALALAEIARADRITPYLTDAELHALAETGADYLRKVSDYRGFTPGEGWRHGVAHGADLALQLALNARLSRADAGALLGAIAVQVAPLASPYYHHGEAARLARPVLYLAKRSDIDDAAWAAWFKALHPDRRSRWDNASEAGLSAVHNSTAFAQSIYVNAAEAQDPQIKRLAPLASAMLKALP